MTEEDAVRVVGALARIERDAARACARLLDEIDKPEAWLRLKQFHGVLSRNAERLEAATRSHGSAPPAWDFGGSLLVVGASLWGAAGTRASLAAARVVAEVPLRRAEAALVDPRLPDDLRRPLEILRDTHRRQIRYIGRVLAVREARAYS